MSIYIFYTIKCKYKRHIGQTSIDYANINNLVWITSKMVYNIANNGRIHIKQEIRIKLSKVFNTVELQHLISLVFLYIKSQILNMTFKEFLPKERTYSKLVYFRIQEFYETFTKRLVKISITRHSHLVTSTQIYTCNNICI